MRGLLSKALDFARSYELELFIWHKAKLSKTNNRTERFYDEKKGAYRRNSRDNNESKICCGGKEFTFLRKVLNSMR